MNNIRQQQKTPHSKKHSSHKKQWIVGLVVAVFLAVGAVGVWFFFVRQQQATPDVQTASEITNQTVSDAQALANNGKIDEAKAAYDVAAKNTNDIDQKSIYLSQKATLLFNDGQYKEALVIALESEAVKKDAVIESFIAQIYEKMGDNQKAIEYYEKTITLIDKSQSVAESDIRYYQSTIQRLGGVTN